MRSSRVVAALVVVLLASACDPAPPYTPAKDERFWSVVAIERWQRHDNIAGQTVGDHISYGPAIVTWRLGKEAPLPRAWKSGDCMVTEGTWADTEFAPPSLGKASLTIEKEPPVSFVGNRTDATLSTNAFRGWIAGDEIDVTSEGEDVPAFAFSGTAPPLATLNTWNLEMAESRSIHLSRYAQLTLTWVGQSGSVAAYLIQWDLKKEQNYFHTAWCTFPGETGIGVIPEDVMRSFAPQTEISSSDFYFGGVARQQLTVDAFDLDWQVSNLRAINVTWN